MLLAILSEGFGFTEFVSSIDSAPKATVACILIVSLAAVLCVAVHGFLKNFR